MLLCSLFLQRTKSENHFQRTFNTNTERPKWAKGESERAWEWERKRENACIYRNTDNFLTSISHYHVKWFIHLNSFSLKNLIYNLGLGKQSPSSVIMTWPNDTPTPTLSFLAVWLANSLSSVRPFVCVCKLQKLF